MDTFLAREGEEERERKLPDVKIYTYIENFDFVYTIHVH